MPAYCEIKIKGHLDPRWAESLAGLKFTQLEGDGTLLSGLLPDQAALYGLLERMRDLNLTLVSLTCGDPPDLSSDNNRKENNDGQDGSY